MRLITLRIGDFRNIADLAISLHQGFNVFVGPNGSGKTSILEAAYLLSHAQSFRPGPNDALIRTGTGGFTLFGEIQKAPGRTTLGLARASGSWMGKVNGEPIDQLSNLLRESALVCLEPGSHALISGSSLLRRRFLDWGVFHVEPEHFERTRRFQRYLRQRNALLKRGAATHEIEAWDEGFSLAGEAVAVARERYFDGYRFYVNELLNTFLPELGSASISLTRGWARESTLAEALRHSRAKDIARGHTSRGPHRADWSVAFERAPSRDYLSRGQEKLCAFACVLAQAQMHASIRQEWPVVALDDLASELDEQHQEIVLSMLIKSEAQVLITGTHLSPSLDGLAGRAKVFHVEHGRIC